MSDERYDAFISYNHAADDRLAPIVERGLQRLAKPWYRLKAISVYRDTSDTGLTPSLWGTVQQRLDESGWLILFACPESAASEWVEQEVSHWCDTKGSDRVLLVLTGGEIFWDRATSRFTPATTALSPTVAARFTEGPLYLDLRWAKQGVEPTLSDTRFRGDMARLASPIRGLEPEALEGEDIRLQRKARRLARAAVTTVVLLGVAAVIAAVVAVNSQHEAERRARQATARQLGLFALDMPTSELDEALLLSIVAIDLDSGAGTEGFRSSRTLLGRYSRLTSLLPVGEAASDVSIRGVAVSGDGATVAATVQSGAGGTRLVQWDRANGGDPQPTPLSTPGTAVHFDDAGRVLVGSVGEPWTVVDGGQETLGAGEATVAAADDASGRALLDHAGTLELVDLADGNAVAEWPLDSDSPVAAIADDRAALVAESTLHLVDAATGDEIASAHLDDVPAGVDVLGGLVATLAGTGRVTLWRAHGDQLQADATIPAVAVLIGNPEHVEFAAHGTRVVVVGDEGTAIIDPATAAVLASGETGAGPLAVDPSGRYAAVGGTTLTVWDVVTGERVVAVPDKASAMAWSGCADADSCRLVVAGEAIDAWDPATKQRTRLADETNAQSVAITDDGATVVSAGWGPTVAVWTLDLQRDPDFFEGVQLTFEGAPAAKDEITKDFAVLVGGDTVKVTKADSTLLIPTGPVERMRLVGALNRLVTMNGSVMRLFDTESAKQVPLDPRCAGDLVATSPDGGMLVAHRAGDGRTVVCDTTTGKVVAGGRIEGAALPAEVVAVDDDGAVALGGAGYLEYHAINGASFDQGRAVDARFGEEPAAIRAIAVRDGHVVVGVRSVNDPTEPARVLLWDATSGGAAVEFDTDQTDVAAVALIGSANDIAVVAGRSEEDGPVTVQAWETDTRRRLGRGFGGLEGDVVYLTGSDVDVMGTDAEGRSFAWLLDRDPRREVCAIVGRGLTRDEWNTAAGGALRNYDYDEVCSGSEVQRP